MEVFKTAQIILLGLLPSLIWLWFYLRRDRHPEPRRLLVIVFLLGFLATPLIGWLELCLNNPLGTALNINVTPPSQLCQEFRLPEFFGLANNSLTGWVAFFLIVAALEELAKFLIARFAAVPRREFDEPVDTMVYLIVAALGFAASENVFAALNIAQNSGLISGASWLATDGSVIALLVLRFVGATLLHTLAAGMLGYYLALGYFHVIKHGRAAHHVLVLGLIAATLTHAGFNLFVNLSNNLTNQIYVVATLALLIIGMTAVFIDFKKLQRAIFVIR